MKALIPLILILITLTSAQPNVVLPTGYSMGDIVIPECWNGTGWQNGPICAETGNALEIVYGVDALVFCGLYINSDEDFERVSALINQKQAWQCRIAVVPGSNVHVPVNIPVWGLAEPDHLHIGNHINIVLHADRGIIIGAGIYAVRDRFEYVMRFVDTLARVNINRNQYVHMHFPVKWFRGHTFLPLTGGSNVAHGMPSETSGGPFMMLLGIMLGFGFAACLTAVLYHFFLRPRLLRKLIEGKQE